MTQATHPSVDLTTAQHLQHHQIATADARRLLLERYGARHDINYVVFGNFSA
jgi:hypothetical protein